MQQAIAQFHIRVLPVLLRAIDWELTPVAYLLPLPRDKKPIALRRDPDSAFLEIAQEIRTLITGSAALPNRPHGSKASSSVSVHAPQDRSSPSSSGQKECEPPLRNPGNKRDHFQVSYCPPFEQSIPSQESSASIGVLSALGTTLRIYNVHASFVFTVAWSPDGARIASAGADGAVHVWDAATGLTVLNYRGHYGLLSKINLPKYIHVVAWSPKEQHIASAGSGPDIYVWDASTGQTLSVCRHRSGIFPSVYALAWSPDGTSLASICSIWNNINRIVHVWDIKNSRSRLRYIMHSLPIGEATAVAWSPDGSAIASTSGTNKIHVWDANTGERLFTCNLGSSGMFEGVLGIAWSPDGTRLATAHMNGTAQIVSVVKQKKLLTYHGHSSDVRAVAWSPDGTCLASASHDKTVQLWDAETGSTIFTYRGHTHWTTAVAWSPDGTRIASSSNDRTVHIWQAKEEERGD
jgi:WD40 repeat protein